ncbi:MAG: radical SAM protein [Deltaproteobacteria bacterium]|nr:radical SAM protein [Deltaproteobacteria bacterium]
MRVALVNPPWRRPGHYGVRAGSRWPHFEVNGCRYMPFPFYLAYAAALLEQDGFEVSVFDGCATKEADEAFLDRVVDFRPDLLVQENATASIAEDLRWAEAFKTRTGAFALMTGHHVGKMRDDLGRYPAIDALAGGEWEYTVLEVAQRRRDGRGLAGIAGLTHRDDGGNLVHEPRRPNVETLDALPFPHRRTLAMDLYHDNPGDLPDPCLQLIGSRGCPYTCHFCVWPQVVYEDNRYRVRSAKNMADEIEQIFRRETFPYRSYYFDDDTFNIGNTRLSDFADELIMRGLDHIPWGAMCRPDTLAPRVLERLRRAGLHAVKYGVESGNQEIVEINGKKLDLEKLRETMRVTRGLGVKTHLTFSFGLIGETRETMRQTLDLALELSPDTLQFSIATPFPGTRFYAYAEEKGLLLTQDFSAYDGMSRCVVRTDHVSAEELESFLQHAYETWNEHVAGRGGLFRRVAQQPVASVKVALGDPRRVVHLARGVLSRALARGDRRA